MPRTDGCVCNLQGLTAHAEGERAVPLQQESLTLARPGGIAENRP